MPAYARRRSHVQPRDRALALGAVVLVQAVLAVVLVRGFHVALESGNDQLQRLITIVLPKAPPLRPRPVIRRSVHPTHHAAAPAGARAPVGGSPGRAHAQPSFLPVAASVAPPAAVSGGGNGVGPAAGSGTGGGSGGAGAGDDDGGTDLEQIAGAITSHDYPANLREAGIGGRVSFVFKV